MDKLESREITEHGSNRVEQQGGQTSQDLEEAMGIKIECLHEALEEEGQESRKKLLEDSLLWKIAVHQAPPIDRLETQVDLSSPQTCK